MTTSTIPVLVFEILRVIERRTNERRRGEINLNLKNKNKKKQKLEGKKEKKRNIAAKKSIITINEPLSNLL
jgi:hypothetical protein